LFCLLLCLCGHTKIYGVGSLENSLLCHNILNIFTLSKLVPYSSTVPIDGNL
jgi:hypothetical protein